LRDGWQRKLFGEAAWLPMEMIDLAGRGPRAATARTCNQTVMSGVIDENKAENVDEFGDGSVAFVHVRLQCSVCYELVGSAANSLAQ
jgi:hypothetical protein